LSYERARRGLKLPTLRVARQAAAQLLLEVVPARVVGKLVPVAFVGASANAPDARWDAAGLAVDESETEFLRLATPVAKFWVCKVTPWVVAEALECIGGDGFVEDSVLPRIYRESPLNSIWEGAGNIQALDAVRAMAKMPDSLNAFVAEVGSVSELDTSEANARRMVERLALALLRSLVVRHGSPAVADAFIARGASQAYGTHPVDVNFAAVVERHRALH
jgi:putative acyl-CoA dehydrogenase